MVNTSFLFRDGKYLHGCVSDRGRGRCLSDRGGALDVRVVGTVYSALLDRLLGRRGRADNALAVKLELGARAACKLQSAENVVVLANLRDAALLVAGSGRSWDVRDINTSVGVVAVCDALVECVCVRRASRNCVALAGKSEPSQAKYLLSSP